MRNGYDPAIEELVVAKQWKQALNLCDKKLKKTNRDDNLTLSKICILFMWPEGLRRDQGVKELEDLLERKPPVSNLETLARLEHFLEEVKPIPSKQLQFWLRAATAYPSNEQLHLSWFRSKLNRGDFYGAQQACMIWMKNFPNQRAPYFLYILTTHWISETVLDPKEKELAQNLAYKFISRAARDTPEPDGNVAHVGRYIYSIQDFQLLLRIYRAQKRYTEALDVVHGPRLGLPDQPGSNRWDVMRQMMDLLALKQDWKDLYELCRNVLLGSLPDDSGRVIANLGFNFGFLGNDWKVWQLFLRASNKLIAAGEPSETQNLILTCWENAVGRDARNPRLAMLSWFTSEAFEGRAGYDTLLSAIVNYFRDFSSKLTCFNDIKTSVLHLDIEGQKRLLSVITSDAQDTRPRANESEANIINWITREVNALKLEYYLVISKDEHSQNTEILASFIGNCLRLYILSSQFGRRLPASDRRPGDDAALLAAMGFVRLYKCGKKPALLQSIYILEILLSHSPHNYDALLILVRLYMFLGAGSLALNRYSRLSIKNLQHATISWVLFTRISTIHPYPAACASTERGQSVKDPRQDALQILKWHKSIEELSLRSIHEMQEIGQWDMSIDALETCHSVMSNFAYCSMVIESKRMARLRSSRPNERVKVYLNLPSQTKDTRDRAAFPNYEGGKLTFEEHLPMAGTSRDPSDYWLASQLRLSRFGDQLNNNESDIQQVQIDALMEGAKQNQDDWTDVEKDTFAILESFIKLCMMCSTKNDRVAKTVMETFTKFFEFYDHWISVHSDNLESEIETGDNFSTLLTSELKVPHWVFFHIRYSYLDLCKMFTATLDHLVAENKKHSLINDSWLSDERESFQIKSQGLVAVIGHSAIDLQDNLRDQSNLRRMRSAILDDDSDNDQDEVATALRELDHDLTSHRICQAIRDSWIENLDGLIRTKLD